MIALIVSRQRHLSRQEVQRMGRGMNKHNTQIAGERNA
jgi:hypothetical protein